MDGGGTFCGGYSRKRERKGGGSPDIIAERKDDELVPLLLLPHSLMMILFLGPSDQDVGVTWGFFGWAKSTAWSARKTPEMP